MDVDQSREVAAAPGPSPEGSAPRTAAAAPTLRAFAVVDEVSEGSPAATAGIMVSFRRGRMIPQSLPPPSLGMWLLPLCGQLIVRPALWLHFDSVTVIFSARSSPSGLHVHAFPRCLHRLVTGCAALGASVRRLGPGRAESYSGWPR